LKYSPELEFQNGLPFEVEEDMLDGYLKVIASPRELKEDVSHNTAR
jgi:hypothetical protein